MKRTDKLKEEFVKIYGNSEGEILSFASPGRVNLIGEHIDYCGGYVFPAALTLDNVLLVRKNGTHKLNMYATDLKKIYTADLNDLQSAKNLKWGTYQAGVAIELQKEGVRTEGLDMLFDSTLPFGSGLSSSASIELVTLMAMYRTSPDYGKINLSNIRLALLGQSAEHNFCNVNCGIMDQFASAMGKENHAILLNCSTLDYKYVPLDLGKYSLVLANTNKKHALGASKYNERRAEVDEGLQIMRKALPGKEANDLCSYNMAELAEAKEYFTGKPVIYRRVHHVISENQRVLSAVETLSEGNLHNFGSILKKANNSIRYDYEVTGAELDAMYDIASSFEYCIGSRMTGAGFGGCTVNIVETSKTEEFCNYCGEEYLRFTGIVPSFYICSIGDGTRQLDK